MRPFPRKNRSIGTQEPDEDSGTPLPGSRPPGDPLPRPRGPGPPPRDRPRGGRGAGGDGASSEAGGPRVGFHLRRRPVYPDQPVAAARRGPPGPHGPGDRGRPVEQDPAGRPGPSAGRGDRDPRVPPLPL